MIRGGVASADVNGNDSGRERTFVAAKGKFVKASPVAALLRS